MSSKQAPPETDLQREVREWWTSRLAERGVGVGWGRDKHGKFLSEFAKDAEAAWKVAKAERGTSKGTPVKDVLTFVGVFVLLGALVVLAIVALGSPAL